EIVDGQDGNTYLYVGEKDANSGREIKIGIAKGEFESKNAPIKGSERSQLENNDRTARNFVDNIEKIWLKEWRKWQTIEMKDVSKRNIMELEQNTNIKTCCDKDCLHYLSIKDYPAPTSPTSPKTIRGGKPASKQTNQINSTDKNQLLQYFLTYHITKITLNNGQLVVEYDNSQKGQKEVNKSELEKYKELIQNQPNHSLSLSDLQDNSDSNSTTKNPDHKLVIGLVLGTGAVILGGEATARVYLKAGKGQAQIRTKNGKEKDLKGYFYMEPSLCEDIFKPLKLFSKENEYDLL
ncbi:1841_t:CDS:2, partial [Funneliformis geosporum]